MYNKIISISNGMGVLPFSYRDTCCWDLFIVIPSSNPLTPCVFRSVFISLPIIFVRLNLNLSNSSSESHLIYECM